MAHNTSYIEKDWRCVACDALLGAWHGAWLELKYKRAVYTIRGDLQAACHCRRCGTRNVIQTEARARAPPAIT